MLLIIFSVLVATLGIIWWLIKKDDTPTGFKKIPGPWGLPFLGNVLQVGSAMHLQFAKWADKYGDIFQIKLGPYKSIVISDPKMVKDIFTGDPAFAGRLFFEGFEMYPGEQLGIIGSEGELWEVHRRFLLRQLRDFGFGKSSMEQLVMDEVIEVLNRFKALPDRKVTKAKQIFEVAVINSLWMIVANKRFAHDDPLMVKMMAEFSEMAKQLVERAIIFFVPLVRYFLPVAGFEEMRNRNRDVFRSVVDEHKATFQEDIMRDFIDVYISEMNAQKNNPSSMFYGDRAERNLHVILTDLFFAGTDTTSATISFALMYLTKYGKVQKKMQDEISNVTWDNRMVSVSDRPNLPYTSAIIEEALRCSSIVPSGVQHRAMASKEFKDYFIQKDTWIFPNLYHIHHSPKIWGDPENFRPERFLSKDEKVFKRSENLMAFQVGRRQCVGEALARDTIFLFLTNIFQKYSTTFDPTEPEPSLEPCVNLVLMPQPFTAVLTDRNVKT